MKLVDAGDSKSPAARRAGSIPAPGTTDKAAQFQKRAAFFFFPLKTLCSSSDSVRGSAGESGPFWGHIWGHIFRIWGHISQSAPAAGSGAPCQHRRRPVTRNRPAPGPGIAPTATHQHSAPAPGPAGGRVSPTSPPPFLVPVALRRGCSGRRGQARWQFSGCRNCQPPPTQNRPFLAFVHPILSPLILF